MEVILWQRTRCNNFYLCIGKTINVHVNWLKTSNTGRPPFVSVLSFHHLQAFRSVQVPSTVIKTVVTSDKQKVGRDKQSTDYWQIDCWKPVANNFVEWTTARIFAGLLILTDAELKKRSWLLWSLWHTNPSQPTVRMQSNRKLFRKISDKVWARHLKCSVHWSRLFRPTGFPHQSPKKAKITKITLMDQRWLHREDCLGCSSIVKMGEPQGWWTRNGYRNWCL